MISFSVEGKLFLCGEVPCVNQISRSQIERRFLFLHSLGRGPLFAAAQHRTQAGQQLLGRVRHAEVVVGAGIEGFDAAIYAVRRREDDDGYVSSRAQLLGELAACVHEDGIWLEALEVLEGFG